MPENKGARGGCFGPVARLFHKEQPRCFFPHSVAAILVHHGLTPGYDLAALDALLDSGQGVKGMRVVNCQRDALHRKRSGELPFAEGWQVEDARMGASYLALEPFVVSDTWDVHDAMTTTVLAYALYRIPVASWTNRHNGTLGHRSMNFDFYTAGPIPPDLAQLIAQDLNALQGVHHNAS